MENISNAKIEKLKTDIEKSKTKIAEYQAKLKEQEKLLVTLEDLEIVARFRSQNGNEDLAAKLRNNKEPDEQGRRALESCDDSTHDSSAGFAQRNFRRQNEATPVRDDGAAEKEERLNANHKTE